MPRPTTYEQARRAVMQPLLQITSMSLPVCYHFCLSPPLHSSAASSKSIVVQNRLLRCSSHQACRLPNSYCCAALFPMSCLFRAAHRCGIRPTCFFCNAFFFVSSCRNFLVASILISEFSMAACRRQLLPKGCIRNHQCLLICSCQRQRL